MSIGINLALRDALVLDLRLEKAFCRIYEGCIMRAFALLSTLALFDFKVTAFLMIPIYLGGVFFETRALLAITAEKFEID